MREICKEYKENIKYFLNNKKYITAWQLFYVLL